MSTELFKNRSEKVAEHSRFVYESRANIRQSNTLGGIPIAPRLCVVSFNATIELTT